MTLNVTVLTRDRIYQCADFRLRNGATDSLITDESTKIVSLQYDYFFGVLTYTGVGQVGSKDTSVEVVEWLSRPGERRLDEVCDDIAERSTTWLRRISRNRPGTVWPHTFTLASFAGGKSSVTVISNFEDCWGVAKDSVDPEFTISRVYSRGRPIVVVTGQKLAVNRDERRLLVNTSRNQWHAPQRIRDSMMKLNARIANISESNNMVSVGSSVVSLGSDGSGFQTMTPGATVQVQGVMNGLPLARMTEIAESLGLVGAHPVGVSFASVSPEHRPPRTGACKPEIRKSLADQYTLVELAASGYQSRRAHCINDDGVVTGIQTPIGKLGHQFWVWQEGLPVTSLPAINNGGDLRMALSNSGVLVGSADYEDGRIHAFRWQDGSLIDVSRFEDEQASFETAACGVNESGTIVGWIGINPDDRGQTGHRPAVWAPNLLKMEVIGVVPADWAEAVDVAADDTILVKLQRGMYSYPALYQIGDRRIDPIGGEHAHPVIAIKMSADRVILGAINSASGRLALISDAGGPWRRLGTNPGWSPHVMNDTGWIGGSAVHDGFERPWIRMPSGQTIMLPYMAYHSCRLFGINAHGDVVGQASGDHGNHAILWRNDRR